MLPISIPRSTRCFLFSMFFDLLNKRMQSIIGGSTRTLETTPYTIYKRIDTYNEFDVTHTKYHTSTLFVNIPQIEKTYIYQLNWKERYHEKWNCFLFNSTVIYSVYSDCQIENGHAQTCSLTSRESVEYSGS